MLAFDGRGHDLVEGGLHAVELELAMRSKSWDRSISWFSSGCRNGHNRRWSVAQCQRCRCEDRGWRPGITLTSKDVEDDVGGVDAVGDRFGARGLDRR